MCDWLSQGKSIQPQLLDIYRDLHRHPELGNREFRTTEKIEEVLKELEIQTFRMTETGVIGYLECQPEADAVAFRADIDALPVEEETGAAYASQVTGVMHACGHDLHTTALLGTAMILSRNRKILTKNVVFIFQPDEEGDGGAQRILDSGILERLRVKAVFGAHINPDLPAGTVGVKYGRFYASACVFDVRVHGKGAHGAEPEKGIDPIYGASKICQGLKELTGYRNGERAVVTVGSFHGGNVRNIIPDQVELMGILRTAGIELRDEMKSEIRRVLRETDEECGTRSELNMRDGYVGVTNHPGETELVEDVGRQLLGADQVVVEKEATMTTEDFGFFLLKYPGSYYHIGVGSPYPLHSSKMCPNTDAIPVAASLHAAVAAGWMEQEVRSEE